MAGRDGRLARKEVEPMSDEIWPTGPADGPAEPGRVDAPPDDGPLFRLIAPPAELWGVSRLAQEYGVRPGIIRAWLRKHLIPEPWHRRCDEEHVWAPELVGPDAEYYRVTGELRRVVGYR
jgi:hypothetical protein